MVSFGIRKTFRKFFPFRLPQWRFYKGYFENKVGIEIGGPSHAFGITGPFPVYESSTRVDGTNFSSRTIWEGDLKDEGVFSYHGKKLGTQYVRDATSLKGIREDSYDFLLSSHCLEHVANPLKALTEWFRVLKRNGKLVLILPNPRYTFDRKRTVTSFDHLLDDLNNDIGEDDMTHVEEFIRECDFDMCKSGYDSFEHFASVCFDNFKFRCVHQHVFDAELVKKMAEHCGFRVLDATIFKKINMYFFLEKA